MILAHDLLTLKPGVYDILLSDEYNRSYIKKIPSSKLYNVSEWVYVFGSPSKCIHSR